MAKQFINPESLSRPMGYTHTVVASGGKTVYVSGQVGLTKDGELAGRDLRSQVAQAYRNLLAALEAAGAKPSDVVKSTVYVVNYRPEDIGVIREERGRVFQQERMPASTLVGVQALASDGILFEVEAIAVIEDGA